MKKISLLFILTLGIAVVTACGSSQKPETSNPPTTVGQYTPTQATQVTQETTSQDLTRSDSQGAVTVEVKPVNLTDPGETLSFEIGLDTHSVDLSMDLATLATLTADNGRTVQATVWDAPQGGHHVSGTLLFPANLDGKPVLDGATKLTLIIKDLDAAERDFSWDLPQ